MAEAVVEAALRLTELGESPDGRLLVRACRAWSEAADDFLLRRDDSSEDRLVATARSMPLLLCSLVEKAPVLHEEVLVSFEYALRVVQTVVPDYNSVVDTVVEHLAGAMQDPPDTLSTFELKRLETLCEFLRLALDRDSSAPRPKGVGTSLLVAVEKLQQRVISLRGSPAFTRDCMVQASSLRRASVALCEVLLRANPAWVGGNSEAFLALALRTLGSPLLLEAGLAAFSPHQPPAEIAEAAGLHLRRGALEMDKLQLAAVKDLLLSIQRLASTEHGRPLLLDRENPLPRTIAEMYDKAPKCAHRKPDNIKEWKSQLFETFLAFLRPSAVDRPEDSTHESLYQASLTMLRKAAADFIAIKSHLDHEESLHFESIANMDSLLRPEEVSLFCTLCTVSDRIFKLDMLSTDALTDLLHSVTCFLISVAESSLQFQQDTKFTTIFACVFVMVKQKLPRKAQFDDELVQLLSEIDLYIRLSVVLFKCGRSSVDAFSKNIAFLQAFDLSNPFFALNYKEIQSTVVEVLNSYLLMSGSTTDTLDFHDLLSAFVDLLGKAS